MSCSSAITSQSFLVKKIVFNVKLLPVVKIGSALIVSIIFWLLLVICLLVYGYYPDLNWVGVIYFLGCAVALILSLGLLLSSITVFMPDVGQMVSIFIQVMFWATPIFWNKDMLHGKLQLIILFNPFAYIVDGIRDSVIYDIPFCGHYKNGLFFWVFTIVLFIIGNRVFNKLRPHFADVL